MNFQSNIETSIYPVDALRIGRITTDPRPNDLLDELVFELDDSAPDAKHLKLAATQLRRGDVPVAFGTETVYGLGANATSSGATLGIYRAKQRPLDNPLIVHIASLRQLRALLRPGTVADVNNGTTDDPIPEIYKPLIKRFWPGPLTIILPNAKDTPLAHEVTAGLSTFGARMPRHLIALALIQLADVPVAAPSANASTKPSPTAAEHVAHDLNGRIETILDSGPCDVGVESTVVDGLCNPPLILRPGGISIEQLRQCPGWENTEIGYKNAAENESKPKAPGMKYRHYSPVAKVVLFNECQNVPSLASLTQYLGASAKMGVIRTKTWRVQADESGYRLYHRGAQNTDERKDADQDRAAPTGLSGLLETLRETAKPGKEAQTYHFDHNGLNINVCDMQLGPHTADIARGIFAALRTLDKQGVDVIIVEGIDDEEGDIAAAVMNRLRKAAEVKISA